MANIHPSQRREGEHETLLGAAASPSESSASISQLLTDLVRDAQTLVQKEFALARREIMQEVDTFRQGLTMLMIGGAILLMSGILLTIALAQGIIALWDLPQWLGYLIVGIVFAIIGGVVAQNASQRLKEINPVPEQTIDSVRKDVAWVQEQTSSDKT